MGPQGQIWPASGGKKAIKWAWEKRATLTGKVKREIQMMRGGCGCWFDAKWPARLDMRLKSTVGTRFGGPSPNVRVQLAVVSAGFRGLPFSDAPSRLTRGQTPHAFNLGIWLHQVINIK